MAKRGTFIGSAYVSITGDDSSLGKVLAGVRKKMQAFGKSMERFGLKMIALGSAITAPLALATKQFAALGDEAAKGAIRAGLTAAEYSEFAHVAQLAGTTGQRFEKAMQAMARGLFDAKRGAGEMLYVMDELKLTWRDLESLKTEEKFLLLAQRISMIPDPSIKAAIAMKAFGKAGAELLPMFQGGSAAIQHYREEARRLGVSVLPEMAKRSQILTDMMFRFQQSIRGVVLVIGNQLAPVFVKSLTVMTNLVVNIRRFIESNRELISTIFNIGVALTAVGAGFVALGAATKVLSQLVTPGGILIALAAILAYISGLLDPLIKKWGKVVSEFEIGGKTIKAWLEVVSDAWTVVVSAFKGIGSDIAKIFRAAIPTIGAVWDAIWERAKDSFLTFADFILRNLQSLFAKISRFFQEQAAKMSSLNWLKTAVEEIAGFSAAASRKLAGVRGTIRGTQKRREGLSAEYADIAGRELGALGGVAVGAGGRIADRFEIMIRRLGEVGKNAIGPLVEKIFGEKPAEKVKSFFDIFQGLGQKFREFERPLPAMAGAPGAASRAGLLVSGTFSGRAEAIRGATRTNDLLGQIVQATKATARILDRKLTGPGWSDEEPI